MNPSEMPAEGQGIEAFLRRAVPAKDLTMLFSKERGTGESPLAGQGHHDAVFAAVARALHGQSQHALLVGDRGVGQSTVQLELARRAATGEIPTLNNRAVLRRKLVDKRR